MAVIIESYDGSTTRSYPRGAFFRQLLDDGNVAISVSPSGDWDHPARFEITRGEPSFFVNSFGVRVGRINGVTFWEEEDPIDAVADRGREVAFGVPNITVYVTVPS